MSRPAARETVRSDHAPPDVLVTTRDSLHRAAEHLLAAARKRSTGEITLCPRPAACALPAGRRAVVELDGGDVVVRGPAATAGPA